MATLSLALVSVHADCPICGVRRGQIDTSRERAIQVVTDAMKAHIAQEHPEAAQ